MSRKRDHQKVYPTFKTSGTFMSLLVGRQLNAWLYTYELMIIKEKSTQRWEQGDRKGRELFFEPVEQQVHSSTRCMVQVVASCEKMSLLHIYD